MFKYKNNNDSFGIIICIKNSRNFNLIETRVKKLFNKLIIQEELKHPLNPTIGCYNAHIKAIKKALDIMNNNKKIEYVLIGEEDIIIDYDSPSYKNIIECISKYNKNSEYILHLGGIPTFTNNLNNIIFNNDSKNNHYKLPVYLATCYIINNNIGNKLLKALNECSQNIHCDAVFANSNIKQYLVKGNLVNQENSCISDNTFIHNFISTKNISSILIFLNKFNLLFIVNTYVYFFIIYIYIFNFNLQSFTIIFFESILYFCNKFKYLLLNKKISHKLSKNIFLKIECLKLIRLVLLYNLII